MLIFSYKESQFVALVFFRSERIEIICLRSYIYVMHQLCEICINSAATEKDITGRWIPCSLGRERL